VALIARFPHRRRRSRVSIRLRYRPALSTPTATSRNLALYGGPPKPADLRRWPVRSRTRAFSAPDAPHSAADPPPRPPLPQAELAHRRIGGGGNSSAATRRAGPTSNADPIPARPYAFEKVFIMRQPAPPDEARGHASASGTYSSNASSTTTVPPTRRRRHEPPHPVRSQQACRRVVGPAYEALSRSRSHRPRPGVDHQVVGGRLAHRNAVRTLDTHW